MVLYAAPVRGSEDQRTRAVGAVGAGVMRRSKRRTPIALRLCADHRSRADIEKAPAASGATREGAREDGCFALPRPQTVLQALLHRSVWTPVMGANRKGYAGHGGEVARLWALSPVELLW